jgi:hypothetical protein
MLASGFRRKDLASSVLRSVSYLISKAQFTSNDGKLAGNLELEAGPFSSSLLLLELRSLSSLSPVQEGSELYRVRAMYSATLDRCELA